MSNAAMNSYEADDLIYQALEALTTEYKEIKTGKKIIPPKLSDDQSVMVCAQMIQLINGKEHIVVERLLENKRLLRLVTMVRIQLEMEQRRSA